MIITPATITPPTPPSPPAPQGGYAVWWANTIATSLALQDNVALIVGANGSGTYLFPVQLSLSGLPAYTFAAFVSPYTSTATVLYIYTSAQSPPGTYTVTLSAENPAYTTTSTFTLTITAATAPVDETSILSGKGKLYGLTRKGQSGRSVIRGTTPGVNPSTVRQQRWRHIFGTLKRTWISLGPHGANNAPTDGTDPQTAWLAQNLTYLAPRTPGAIVDGIQGEPIPGPLATAEAYMLMVQTTMQSTGQPQLPTPAVTTNGITTQYPGSNKPMGSEVFSGALQYSPPTQSGTYAYTPTWPLGPIVVYLEIYPPLSPSAALTMTLGYSDAYISATLNQPTIYNSAVLTVTLATDAPPGSHTVGVEVTYEGGNYTLEVTFVTGNVPLQALYPSPTFQAFESFEVYTVYDHNYNVTGFTLLPATQGAYNEFLDINGMAAIASWKLTASPQYSSSYSPPAASTWSPIAFGTINIYSAPAVLTAWEAFFGTLPNSGHIYFQLEAFDPASGCVGSGVSQYATWAKGTLKGFQRTAWLGPIFSIPSPTGDISQAAGSTVGHTFTVQGAPSQTGWDGGAGVPYAGSITFTPYPQAGVPAGPTYSFSPQPAVIASGVTTPVTVTLTITIPAGYSSPSYKVTISATDGISTDSFHFLLTVT